jgi:hypothetical protein
MRPRQQKSPYFLGISHYEKYDTHARTMLVVVQTEYSIVEDGQGARVADRRSFGSRGNGMPSTTSFRMRGRRSTQERIRRND